MSDRRVYEVVVEKVGGEVISGRMKDDGLQSLWSVETDDGEVRYVSVLDRFVSKEEVS